MRLLARPLVVTATALLLALSLTGCGSDDDKASGDTTPSAAGSSGVTDGSVGAATGGTAGTEGATPADPQPADSELCSALADIIEVVDPITGPPDEGQWDDIQGVYAALGEVDLPAGTPAREREGRDAAVEAITSLSWAEAEKVLAEDSGEVPGLTAEENAKAAEFFTWAGQQCPSVLGTANGDAATPSSITTQ